MILENGHVCWEVQNGIRGYQNGRREYYGRRKGEISIFDQEVRQDPSNYPSDEPFTVSQNFPAHSYAAAKVPA